MLGRVEPRKARCFCPGKGYSVEARGGLLPCRVSIWCKKLDIYGKDSLKTSKLMVHLFLSASGKDDAQGRGQRQDNSPVRKVRRDTASKVDPLPNETAPTFRSNTTFTIPPISQTPYPVSFKVPSVRNGCELISWSGPSHNGRRTGAPTHTFDACNANC